MAASSSSSTSPVCAKCAQPLQVSIDNAYSDDDDEDTSMQDEGIDNEETVPDDVHLLACGDHFHWECLIDTYEIEKCPACKKAIISSPASGSSSSSTQQPQILVDINNEGGLQSQIDIFPLLQEEAYLRAYPEEKKCRAFLEFCREGDHRAIAELLKSTIGDDDEDEGPQKSAGEILRYQDPLADMQSGLHAAAANGHREVAWLLLLLASELPELEFPALVFQEAATLGVMRGDIEDKVDVRGLRDGKGRTAEDVAREVGVIWNGWFGNGRLSLP